MDDNIDIGFGEFWQLVGCYPLYFVMTGNDTLPDWSEVVKAFTP